MLLYRLNIVALYYFNNAYDLLINFCPIVDFFHYKSLCSYFM